MNTRASQGKEFASTSSVNKKEPTGTLTVPMTNLTELESIALGFRDNLFDVVDDDGSTVLGTMTCTSFGGGDAIIMSWGKGKNRKSAFVRGRDLFGAWLKQADPEAAKKLPEGVRYAS